MIGIWASNIYISGSPRQPEPGMLFSVKAMCEEWIASSVYAALNRLNTQKHQAWGTEENGLMVSL